MIKRPITYEDVDGNKVTDVHSFHLSKREMIELEVKYEGGLEAALRRIIETNDRKRLVEEFQNLILLSYGVRSEDGKSFLKNDELREKFTQTLAYNALFEELATNDEAAAEFIKGIVPKDFSMPDVKDVQLPAVKE